MEYFYAPMYRDGSSQFHPSPRVGRPENMNKKNFINDSTVVVLTQRMKGENRQQKKKRIVGKKHNILLKG